MGRVKVQHVLQDTAAAEVARSAALMRIAQAARHVQAEYAQPEAMAQQAEGLT
jgi:hypothetical protein